MPGNDVNKGGRPVGSKETPQMLLIREMQESLKTMGAVRRLVNDQLVRISNTLDNDISLDQRLEITTKLVDMITLLSKAAEVGAKYILDPRKTKGADADDDSSSVIKNLLGKK